MGLIALHIDKKEFDDEVILVVTTLLDYECQIRDYGLADWGIEIVVLVKLVQPIGSHQVQQLGITDRDGILRAVLSQLPGACFLHARIALEFLSPT
jgi:hypothetical protein